MASNVLSWPVLVGHADFQLVQIGTPSSTAANRLTSSADIASGDYVEWGNVQGVGTVVVNSDGTFDASEGVTAFDFYAGNLTDGWGAVATQTLASPAPLDGDGDQQPITSTGGALVLPAILDGEGCQQAATATAGAIVTLAEGYVPDPERTRTIRPENRTLRISNEGVTMVRFPFLTDIDGVPTIQAVAGSRLDYPFDFAGWLDALDDEIVSHEIDAGEGVTVESSQSVDGIVIVWASVEPVAVSPLLTCRIVTAAGREDARSMKLNIVSAR